MKTVKGENRGTLDYVDLEALVQAMHSNPYTRPSAFWIFEGGNEIAYDYFRNRPYNPVDKEQGAPIYLCFLVEREAYNTNGFRVGTEEFTGSIRVFTRRELCLYGPPQNVFPYVVFPSTLDVYNLDAPDAEWEELSEEERNNEDIEPECLYYPPDNDFAYQELAYVLHMCLKHLPEIEFDKETRTWSCGDFEHAL